MRFESYITGQLGEKWNIPFIDFSFSKEINNDRACNISFSQQHLSQVANETNVTPEFILSGGFRELYIEDENNNIIYGGYIGDLQFSCGTTDSGSWSVASKGFMSLLKKRFTQESYSYQDLSYIAWDLIDTSQSENDFSNFGITRGADPTTRFADRTFKYEPIFDALQGMSNLETKNGFDIEVDDTKILNVFYPFKDRQTEMFFKEGVNIESYTVQVPFIDSMANRVFVFGDGFGEDALIVQSDAQDAYKDVYGLLEDELSEKDVILETTLQERGERYLDKNKNIQKVVSLVCDYKVIDYPSLELGDWCKVTIPKASIDQSHRIVKISVGSDQKINITLDSTL